MTWWKGLIAGVLLLAVAGITVAGLRDRPPPATEVQVAKVRKGTISRVIIGAGKVEASTTVKISSNLSGDLVERPVELGDKVKKGQVLGRIDPRPFTAAAKQAQASMSAARADTANAQVDVDRTKLELERVEGLAKRGMSSGAELDKAKSDYNGAQARLSAAYQRHQVQVAAAGAGPDQPLPHHARLSHRRNGHRAQPGDRRAGPRLGLLRGHGDDRGRAEQHGGQDRGRGARGGPPPQRSARRARGGRARGPELRG
jgi:multidrug efflux pump subunit AcrA (membrane-fusion protein)